MWLSTTIKYYVGFLPLSLHLLVHDLCFSTGLSMVLGSNSLSSSLYAYICECNDQSPFAFPIWVMSKCKNCFSSIEGMCSAQMYRDQQKFAKPSINFGICWDSFMLINPTLTVSQRLHSLLFSLGLLGHLFMALRGSQVPALPKAPCFKGNKGRPHTVQLVFYSSDSQ